MTNFIVDIQKQKVKPMPTPGRGARKPLGCMVYKVEAPRLLSSVLKNE